MKFPARLSISSAYPGYSRDAIQIGSRLNIFVDGQLQKGVIAYDRDAGTVTKHQVGEDGRLIIDGDEIAVETIEGRVEVKEAR